MKYLLPFLAACSSVPEECEPQLEKVEQVCDSASVVGKNDNKDLYEAIDQFKLCAGDAYKVICHDDSWQNFLTVEERR